MKFTASRIDLIRAIGAAVRVVERRNTIPILSNIALGAADGQLTIKATDLDIEVTTACAATIEAPGSLTLPAQTFHDILRKIPEGADVTLDALGEHGRVNLRAGRARFTLGTLPLSDFPAIATGKMPPSFEMPAADLAVMLDQVGFAVSTEETRYYLNGIYLHMAGEGEDARLVAVATDGHRLARRVVNPPVHEPFPGVIIPRKAVGEMLRLVDKLAEMVSVSISPTANRLRLEAGGVTLVTKLIDGTFPDYARVIPKGNDRRCEVEAATLLAAVDRVATISSERGRAVKLGFADGRITIEVSNPAAGTARDEIDGSYDAEPLEIGFNARYLTDILGVLINAGATSTTLHLGNPGSPAILEAAEAPDLTIVLMPMRV